MKKSLIAIQEKYIDTVNAGIARWSHRKDGGYSNRIIRGATRKVKADLGKLGFTDVQIEMILKDARDMAKLIRESEEPE